MPSRRTFATQALGAGLGMVGLTAASSRADAQATSVAWRDARQFGATGNGQDDDAPAIQAALDAAAADQGGIVYIPPGVYLIVSPLEISGNAPTTLTGAGPVSRIRSGRPGHLLRLKNASHVVSQLGFEGNDHDTGCGIVVESTAPGSTIAHNEFRAIPSCAVWVHAGTARTTIAFNSMNSCGYGSRSVPPFTSHIRVAAVTDCTIAFNYLSDGPQKAIDCGVGNGRPNDGLLIEGNRVSLMGNLGIGVAGSSAARILGNHVTDCGDNGIDLNALSGIPHTTTICANNHVTSSKDGIFCGHGATGVVIQGNTLVSCIRGMRILDGATDVIATANIIVDTTEGEGIQISARGGDHARLSHITVDGNLIRNVRDVGISVTEADHVVLRNNNIESPRLDGIRAVDAPWLRVYNNRLASIGSPNGRGAAIRLDDQCHNYDIAHNVVAGPTGVGFELGDSNRGFLIDNVWDSADQPTIVGLGDGVSRGNASRESQPHWLSGAGSPEGQVEAPVGSIYLRNDGDRGSTLYVKESGSGSRGWRAK